MFSILNTNEEKGEEGRGRRRRMKRVGGRGAEEKGERAEGKEGRGKFSNSPPTRRFSMNNSNISNTRV